MRKLIAATVAALVFAVGSLAWAQPAAAAAVPAAPGACPIEQWTDPTQWGDCIKRTKEALGNTTGCVTAPMPSTPTHGLAGNFTTEPDSAKRDGMQGMYSTYGVGGYSLEPYGLGCFSDLKRPDLNMWNTIASGEFKLAAAILGGSHGLREHAYNPASVWDGWADQFVTDATEAIYRYVFNIFGVIAITALGLFLIFIARHGNVPYAMNLAGWALLVFLITTGVAKWPAASVDVFDTTATAGLATVHSVIGPAPQGLPADKCPLGGDKCTDHRSMATRSADAATEAILYDAWIDALLGDADSETARKYGPVLYDASTFTWGEAARANTSPALRQSIIDQKAGQWTTIADQIRVEDPQAYEHLQGLHGSDRFGAGLFALFSAGMYATFDIAASLVILVGFAVFRFAVVFLPLLATYGMFLHASGGVRRLGNMVVGAIINIVLFGALAGGYLKVASALFESTLPAWLQIVILFGIGAIVLILMRPDKQLKATVTGKYKAGDGFLARTFIAGRAAAKAAREEAEASDGDAGQPAPRPETATQPPARRKGRGLGTAVSSKPAAETTDADVTDTPRPETTAPTVRRPGRAARRAATGDAAPAATPAAVPASSRS